MQATQLTRAVEIPNSGSARVKDENMAMIEIAVANRNGRKFFMAVKAICISCFKNQSKYRSYSGSLINISFV